MSDEIDFEFDTATFDELRETLEKVATRESSKEISRLCRKGTKKRRKRIQQGSKKRSFICDR